MEDLPNLPPSLQLNDQGCIDQNLSCAGCQYNLRTIRLGDKCPECGLAVANSLDRDRLCFADVKWLGRMRLGLLMIVTSEILFMLMLGVAVMISGEWLLAAALFELLIVSSGGCWVVTCDFDGKSIVKGYGYVRKLARIMTGICFIVLIALMVDLAGGDVAGEFIILAMVISFSAMMAAVYFYASSLVMRVPWVGLSMATRLMAWLLIVFVWMVLAVFMWVTVLFFEQGNVYFPTGGWLVRAFEVLAAIIGLGALGFSVAGVVLGILHIRCFGRIIHAMSS